MHECKANFGQDKYNIFTVVKNDQKYINTWAILKYILRKFYF